MSVGLSPGKVNEMLTSLERQGATIERRGTGRRVTFPNGRWINVHDTPSDVNFYHHIRRATESAGLVFPLEDSKAAKVRAKYRQRFGVSVPDNGEEFVVPEGPLEHVRVPPGARTMAGKRPIDRSIGLVRGAIYNLGPDKRTFWTAEIADQLANFIGFRSPSAANGSGGTGVQRAQGILDWLGYRVVEARPNRSGFIYRWALDPTQDRAARETLPLIVPDPSTADALDEADHRKSRLVNPPEPLPPLDDWTPPEGIKEDVPERPAEPEPEETPDETPQDDVVPKDGQPSTITAPDEVPGPAIAGPVLPQPVPADVLPAAPEMPPLEVTFGSDVDAARSLLDDAGSWSVTLDSLGKAGKRLEKTIRTLGLEGELRVWRRH